MKVEIILDTKLKEKIVKIHTDVIDEDVVNIEKYIRGLSSDKILAFYEDKIKLLDYNDIVRVFSLDKKTIIRTEDKEYFSRMSLGELEDRLPHQFIKVSRGETINLDWVNNLDFSIKGTIKIKMKNKDITYLSRRRMKDFKNALGIL